MLGCFGMECREWRRISSELYLIFIEKDAGNREKICHLKHWLILSLLCHPDSETWERALHFKRILDIFQCD